MTPQIRQKVKAEIKEILVHRADIKRPITYTELCNKIGSYRLSPADDDLHDILGEISSDSCKANKSLLSVFVVNKKGGMPGKGFFKAAIDLGYHIGDYSKFFKDQIDIAHSKYRDPSILTI